jgi:hypothetical protein
MTEQELRQAIFELGTQKQLVNTKICTSVRILDESRQQESEIDGKIKALQDLCGHAKCIDIPDDSEFKECIVCGQVISKI